MALGDPFVGMKTGYRQLSRKSNRVTWSDAILDDDATTAASSSVIITHTSPTHQGSTKHQSLSSAWEGRLESGR